MIAIHRAVAELHLYLGRSDLLDIELVKLASTIALYHGVSIGWAS